MKIKIALLLCIISHGLNAQDRSKLNFGIDYILFGGVSDNWSGEVTYSSRGGAFVEKPFQLKFAKQLYLSPGLSFKKINEKYHGGGLGAGFSSDLDHYALSSYVKVIHKPEIQVLKPASVYFGGFGGARLYTWARGSASSYSVLYPQANWENDNYKEDPSHLFKKLYFGPVAGLEFTNEGVFRPSLEVRYMLQFGEYYEKILRPFELVVNIGIGSKN